MLKHAINLLLFLTTLHLTGCYREKRGDNIVVGLLNGLVDVYNPTQTFDGYNVKDGEIFDMNGKKLASYPGRQCIFYKNGNIACGRGEHLEMLDADTQLLWRTPDFTHKGVHHEICLDADSNIYFLSSTLGPIHLPKGTPLTDRPFRDTANGSVWQCHLNTLGRQDSIRYDAMYHFYRQGKILSSWSSYTNLSELKELITMHYGSFYADTITRLNPEYFHFNSIQVLPHNVYEDSHPEFRAGNLLLGDINFDMMLILDPTDYKILWYHFQPASGCRVLHSLRMQPSGNILMFINQCVMPDSARSPYSKVIELNPLTKQIEWEYMASPPQSMYGDFGGHAQRLPNGNTLVTIDVSGGDTTRRCEVREVTPNKELVWRWYPNVSSMRVDGVYRVDRISKIHLQPFIKKQKH